MLKIFNYTNPFICTILLISQPKNIFNTLHLSLDNSALQTLYLSSQAYENQLFSN